MGRKKLLRARLGIQRGLERLLFNDNYAKLDALALKAGTDKSSAQHNYTKIYSRYFSPIKDKPLKFLEIGIYKGNSVKMWENYFPNGVMDELELGSSGRIRPKADIHLRIIIRSSVFMRAVDRFLLLQWFGASIRIFKPL